MTQRCRVCTHPDHTTIDALLLSGVPDLRVAKQFGIETVSVGRHRRNHILRPTQDRMRLLSINREERDERQRLAAAVASDAPSTQALVEATLGLRAQMTKLTNIEQRLERMASSAERSGAAASVAQLSSQQLRGVEVGARLGSVGGYKPVAAMPQSAERNIVAIEMVFPNSGRREEIALKGTVVNGDLIDPTGGENAPSPHPNTKIAHDRDGKTLGNYWNYTKLPPSENEDEGGDQP
jgi:hypothetical protein